MKALLITIFLHVSQIYVGIAKSENVYPISPALIEDPAFMDILEKELDRELVQARKSLVFHAKKLRADAEQYVVAKFKENLFQSLEKMTEDELEQVAKAFSIRQPRQDDEDTLGNEGNSSGGGTGSGDEDGSDSGSSGGTTTKRTVPLIPVLAGILKSVFGGGENATSQPLNVTHTLQHASKIFFSPLRNVASLINPNRGAGNTPTPKTIIKYYPVPVPVPAATVPPTTPKPKTIPPLRLVGRQGILRREPRAVGGTITEQENVRSTTDTASHIQTSNVKPMYPNMIQSSLYAPLYPIKVSSSSSTPEILQSETSSPISSSSASLVQIPPIYAPSQQYTSGSIGQQASTQKISAPQISSTTVSPPRTKATKPPKPVQIFIPVFAEASIIKTSTTQKTDIINISPNNLPSPHPIQPSSPVVVPVVYPEVTEATSEATTSTEAPKPGLIYVDSIARDVQNSFDGLVKNLPDILKGAKEAIGLLANLREIFGEEEDS